MPQLLGTDIKWPWKKHMPKLWSAYEIPLRQWSWSRWILDQKLAPLDDLEACLSSGLDYMNFRAENSCWWSWWSHSQPQSQYDFHQKWCHWFSMVFPKKIWLSIHKKKRFPIKIVFSHKKKHVGLSISKNVCCFFP